MISSAVGFYVKFETGGHGGLQPKFNFSLPSKL